MTNNGLYAALVASSLLFVHAAGAVSKPITLELKLPKKPGKPAVAPPTMASLLTAGPISLSVVDARGAEDPAVVGGQRIKGDDVYFWRSEQPVAPAVAAQVTQVLQGWLVRVAPEAEFKLHLALKKYYVVERSDTFGSTYLAEVRFTASLMDRGDGVLWTGEAAGESKRPGVDKRASMCNEALSFALSRALAQALSAVKLETEAPAIQAPVATAPTVVDPDDLLADLVRLKAGGVADDILVAYVEQRRLSRPLNVDEILSWKNAGMPDAAIKAATRP